MKFNSNYLYRLTKVIPLSSLIFLTACQNTIVPSASPAVNASATPMASVPSWTAEDFMNAEPLPMPTVDATVEQMRAQVSNVPLSNVDSVSVDGDMGEGSIGAATNLFDVSQAPIPPTPITAPSAVGSQSLYYSSSRLIPQSARLSWPYRAVGKLFIQTEGGGTGKCSAAVIAKRLVVTAGHCVHSGANGNAGYFASFLFVPAYSANGTQAPYGTWASTWFKAAPTWVSGGGTVPNSADFAIIEVADQEINGETKSIAQVVGRLGYKTYSLNPNHVKMLGYPVSFDNGEIMHQVDSGSFVNAHQETVLYGSDMRQGSSGGPWVQNFGRPAQGQPSATNGEFNRLVGVNSYTSTATGPMYMGSSILNREFITLLREACARQTGNCD